MTDKKKDNAWTKFKNWFKGAWWRIILLGMALLLVPLAITGVKLYLVWMDNLFHPETVAAEVVVDDVDCPVCAECAECDNNGDNGDGDNGGNITNTDCYVNAAALGAPADMITAICDATPDGDGVSDRLEVGTKVEIGSITFDCEDTVWFLENFTVPSKANYAFDYKGAEMQIFEAPFVLNTESGYASDCVTRVPFKTCWNTEGDCAPGVDLFPNK